MSNYRSFDGFNYSPSKGKSHWFMAIVSNTRSYNIVIYFCGLNLKTRKGVMKYPVISRF